jgi:hypothetical protein
MAINRRQSDGQSIRIPNDGSRDVQASVQDIKDALRVSEEHRKALETSIGRIEVELEQADKRLKSLEVVDNFEEIETETIFNSPLGIPDGSAVSPGLFFTDDDDLGLFRKGSDSLGFAANGKDIVWIQEVTSNKWLYIVDGDATNYEAIAIQKNVSSDGYILMRAGGTGTVRNLELGTQGGTGYVGLRTNSTLRWVVGGTNGQFYPNTDNAIDIGQDANRVKRIYVEDTNDGENGQIDGMLETHGCAWHDVNGLQTGTTHYVTFWKAPYDCVILKLWGYKLGGTSITLNVYVDVISGVGSGYLLASAYVLSTDNQWVDLGTLQYSTIDASYAGSKRFLGIASSVSGTVTDASLQIDIKRTGV